MIMIVKLQTSRRFVSSSTAQSLRPAFYITQHREISFTPQHSSQPPVAQIIQIEYLAITSHAAGHQTGTERAVSVSVGRRGFNDNASESRDNEKATLQDKEVPSLWAGRGAAGDGHLFPGRSGLRLPVSVREVRMVISDHRSRSMIRI